MIKLSHPQENLFSQNHQSEINPTNHLRPSKLQSNKVELNPIGIAAKTLSQNQNHNLGRMRIRRGQTLEAAFPQPSSSSPPSLASIDSPFQLQEYLSLLIRQDPHNVDRIVSLPEGEFSSNQAAAFSPTSVKGKAKDKELSNDSMGLGMGEEELQPVDTDVWVYEQLRRIVLDFSHPWLVSLQQVCSPKLSPSTCSAMYAGDWMYLCACHGEEKQCCAIDYMIHTIDGTSALLNSARHFPSRTFIPNTSLRHFGSIARRLSRVFVHAWGHHRETFSSCEADTSLYARFYTLVEKYDLVPLKDLPPKYSTSSSDSQNSSSNSNEFSRKGNNPNPVLLSKDPSSNIAKILKRPTSTSTSTTNQETELNGSSNLDRSDSNASRITAIRIGSGSGSEAMKAIGEKEEDSITTENQNGKGEAKVESYQIKKGNDASPVIESQRRELSPDEAPTEVKDEEEEDEDDDEEEGEGEEGQHEELSEELEGLDLSQNQNRPKEN